MIRVALPGVDLVKIAESGQCFRMTAGPQGRFQIVAEDRLLSLSPLGRDQYELDCTEEMFQHHWSPYFDLDTDYEAFLAAVPETDAFLHAAARYSRGMTILRQDPWEMLITFILSQRKNIPAIRNCVERLCAAFGEPIMAEGVTTARAFPTAPALAAQSPEALAACGLGYRTGYVLAAARMVATGEIDLHALRAYSDDQLMEALRTVPGIGEKVASCVMLFGYHRLDAFPRDVWIRRVTDVEYGGQFPVERYAGFAGVIQQYAFYYARHHYRAGVY